MSDEAVRKEFEAWVAFKALLAEAANVADKRDLFEFLQVTADNLRNGVLALKER